MFLDRVEIEVAGGRGGDGSRSFRHEKYIPQGGPDGGDGGRGGHVILRADEHLATFQPYRYHHHFRAETGGGGEGGNRRGKRGEDMVLAVPVGTVVLDKATGDTLADLAHPGDTFVAAKGGPGGRGNASFKSATERSPRFAENGAPGEGASLRLELKLLADVGLVGLPNAGKSSLLAAMSRARPKVGDYAFTTLEPEVGVVESQGATCVVADLPGLIEGAHEGKGLGFQFLRHVERCRLLLHVVDVGTKAVDEALSDIAAIEREVGLYREDVLRRPMLYFLNKVDLTEGRSHAAEVARALHEAHPERDVFLGSAATGQGVGELVAAMLVAVQEAPPPPPVEVTVRGGLGADAFEIVKEDRAFRVLGKAVERHAAMADIENPEAARRFARYLRRLGVERALRERGAMNGDTILIGPVELELEPDAGAEEEAGIGSERPE